MRAAKLLLLATAMLSICAMAENPDPFSTPTIPEPVQRVDAIVNNFRKIAVLSAEANRLDDAAREKVEALTWTLAQENRGRLADLAETFADSDGRPLVSNIEAFLDRIERPGLYQDCDRLAFTDIFEALYASRMQYPQDIRARVESEVLTIRRMKADGQLHSHLRFIEANTSGGEWGSYVAYLTQNYRREQLLKEHSSILPSR